MEQVYRKRVTFVTASPGANLMTTWDPKALVASMSPLSLRAVALRLHVDPAVLCRPLSDRQADRFAVVLGMHPTEVWPDYGAER